MTNWNYVEDTTRPDIKTGVQRCVVVNAVEAVSKATGLGADKICVLKMK